MGPVGSRPVQGFLGGLTLLREKKGYEMRKYIGLVVALACLIGGLFLLYRLFFEADTIRFMFVIGATFLAGIGVAGLVDTWRHWRN